MKKIIASLFVLSILFIGCEKDITTEDISTITNYVTFSFDDTSEKDQLGNNKLIIEKGTPYDVAEHFSATEGSEDVTDRAEIDGTIDVNTPGYYPIHYSAVNADGYSAGVTKGIFVSDPDFTTDISGSYTATVYRTPTGETFTEGFPVNITLITNGNFYINRLLGSYYYDGFGYSSSGSYFVHGFVALHPDNTLTHGASFSPAWQDTLEGEGIVDGSYDPDSGVITYGALYAGGRTFHVTLTPNF
ncbi:BT_2262 family domain-containing protein [uncultured Sunxiuqinia sp.]|uniref:BT_2262 family domain-containing protein n=1 Tax=Sunxiuqinia rutila TaxID=1397841 RepID=UPI002637D244|nr:BT_2262 family domain-containing protein [uncultured Sunxiuqinia sp.]